MFLGSDWNLLQIVRPSLNFTALKITEISLVGQQTALETVKKVLILNKKSK